MNLKGIVLDYKDKKSCALLPDKCLAWDEKSEELQENEELIKYFEKNLDKVFSQTNKIIGGSIEGRGIVCSDDEEAIEIINNTFKELDLQNISSNEISKYNTSLKYNYLM